MGMHDDDKAWRKDSLVKELKDKLENEIFKRGNDGTRYYLLTRDELEEIIESLD